MIQIPEGAFFLGHKVLDVDGEITGSPFFVNKKQLLSHGVALGASGCGKTGLGILLAEEALLNRVPVILIDTNGDLVNLIFQSPRFSKDDFLPWVDFEKAKKNNLSKEEFARLEAEDWKEKLKDDGIEPRRLRKVLQNTRFEVYTPGSTIATPVNVLDFFKEPPVDPGENVVFFSDMVETATCCVLDLGGVEFDPLKSPEFSLLSNLFHQKWSSGETLSLDKIIDYIVEPPFRRIGFFEVDRIFPPEKRKKLAVTLREVINSGEFSFWKKGKPLDFSILSSESRGQVPCSIFYLAHLEPSMKMFFITSFFGKLLKQLNTLPPSNELKCLLYFDGAANYVPSHPTNPPSKVPILTTLKQAKRASYSLFFTSRNPEDVDYRILTNTGNWFVGNFNKSAGEIRILEKLADRLTDFEQEELDEKISSLKPRHFIFKNTDKCSTTIFKARQTQAYMGGSVAPENIKELVQKLRERAPTTILSSVSAASQFVATTRKAKKESQGAPAGKEKSGSRENLQTPVWLSEYFLTGEFIRNAQLVDILSPFKMGSDEFYYSPAIFAKVGLRIGDEEKSDQTACEEIYRLIFPLTSEKTPTWNDLNLKIDNSMLARSISEPYYLSKIPDYIKDRDFMEKLKSDLIQKLYRQGNIDIFQNKHLCLFSLPGESKSSFEKRCLERVEAELKIEVEKIKDKFQNRIKEVRQETEKTVSEKEDELSFLQQEMEEEAARVQKDYFDIATDIIPLKMKIKEKDIIVNDFGIMWIPLSLL